VITSRRFWHQGRSARVPVWAPRGYRRGCRMGWRVRAVPCGRISERTGQTR